MKEPSAALTQAQIPSKLYFKIGEVARIVGVEPYVLRYWETEFREIEPVKSRTKQRLYRRKDVELILRIKGLLYKEGFTIEGARKQIRSRGDGQLPLSLPDGKSRVAFQKVRKGLEEVLKILEA